MQTFSSLSRQEQARYRLVLREMLQVAEAYAVPVMFGPPPWRAGQASGASGFVVNAGGRFFAVTAEHVLVGYEKALESDTDVEWKFGRFIFEPAPRLVWREPRKADVVLLELTHSEAHNIGGTVASVPRGWPPASPDQGQCVIISGYPETLREVDATGTIGFGPASTFLEVKSTGEGYFYCQMDHAKLISFNDEPVPTEGTDFGGWSGGPILLMDTLSYPVIGVVS